MKRAQSKSASVPRKPTEGNAKRSGSQSVPRSASRTASRGQSSGRAAKATSVHSLGSRELIVLSSVIALVCAVLWAGWTGLYLVRRHEGRGQVVAVSMPSERSADVLAHSLQRAGVIDHAWTFSLLLTLSGTMEKIPLAPAVLKFRDDLSPRAVLRALSEGTGLLRVTIPEGSNRFEVAHRLLDAGIIDSVHEFVARTNDRALAARLGINAQGVEGYLFPDTYDLPAGESNDEIIARLVHNFDRRWAELMRADPHALERLTQAALTPHDAVILASIVEEETGSAQDRTTISAVFWNRLVRPDFTPRLLQTDPTVVYGCRMFHAASCLDVVEVGPVVITRSMLADASNPYNTYQHEGLPPGPISNPGVPALSAALHPSESLALYFVAMGNGRSAFAQTRAEHEANVRKYLRRDAGGSRR